MILRLVSRDLQICIMYTFCVKYKSKRIWTLLKCLSSVDSQVRRMCVCQRAHFRRCWLIGWGAPSSWAGRASDARSFEALNMFETFQVKVRKIHEKHILKYIMLDNYSQWSFRSTLRRRQPNIQTSSSIVEHKNGQRRNSWFLGSCSAACRKASPPERSPDRRVKTEDCTVRT